jgi:hypothetical protein
LTAKGDHLVARMSVAISGNRNSTDPDVAALIRATQAAMQIRLPPQKKNPAESFGRA